MVMFLIAIGQKRAEAQTPTPAPWRAFDIATGSDNNTKLIWLTSDGGFQIWNVTSDGQNNAASPVFNLPPDSGYIWSPVKLGVGGDGLTRLLLRRSDGAASIWTLNSDLTFRSYTPRQGPYPGWTPVDMAVARDGTARLLWTTTARQALVWNINTANGNYTIGPTYGPFPDTGGTWSAARLAVGGDGLVRMLWVRPDGAASWWQLDGALNRTRFSPPYGPYPDGSSALFLAMDTSATSDNQSRALWMSNNKAVWFWKLSPDDTAVQNSTYFGPYSGSTPQALSVGSDGQMRALWMNSDNRAWFWKLSPDGSNVVVSVPFGPLPAVAPTPTPTPTLTPTVTPTPTATPIPTPTPNPALAPGKQEPRYNTYRPGDVFAGMDGGRVEWRRNAGQALVNTLTGQPGTSNYGMTFTDRNELLATTGGSNVLNRFSADGTYMVSPATSGSPTSIASYTSEKTRNGDTLDFGSRGAYTPADILNLGVIGPVNRIALSDNGMYVYYSTSDINGPLVRKYQLSGPLQEVARFRLDPTNESANDVAILPGGGCLVAAGIDIVQFDSNGQRTSSYYTNDASGWTSLALDTYAEEPSDDTTAPGTSPKEDLTGSFYVANGSTRVYSGAWTTSPAYVNQSIAPAFYAAGPVYGLAVKSGFTTAAVPFPATQSTSQTIYGFGDTVQVGTTYYFGNNLPPFTPTQPGYTVFDKTVDGTRYHYTIYAYNPPLQITCTAVDSNNVTFLHGYLPFVLNITDNARKTGILPQYLGSNLPDLKIDEVEAITSKGEDVSSSIVVSAPQRNGYAGAFNANVTGGGNIITDGGIITIRISDNLGNSGVCSAMIEPLPIRPVYCNSKIRFTSPVDGAASTDLTGVTVRVETPDFGLKPFPPTAPVQGSYPALRLTAPYISIRRSDGLYWTGASTRTWVTYETLLPTLRDGSQALPSPLPLFPSYSYILRSDDVPPNSQALSETYTLSAYDRAVAGTFPYTLQNITASATTTISRSKSSSAVSLNTRDRRPLFARRLSSRHRSG